MKKNKTVFAKKESIIRKWYLVDARGKVLGRMASQLARILCGKHKPIYSPQADCGDFVVVVNADKVRVTGNKVKDKTYFTHSGYPGGHKLLNFESMLVRHPDKIISLAVAGMLPKSRLGKAMIKKLKIYRGENHPHKTNKLETLEI
ncbi:MAG: 50S ribosomal protein L13 [Candidatus Margulisbacteria bacterium]|nr:50S ribosomal protein L13 [Candidatus Margulisiibacteriota bacterium]